MEYSSNQYFAMRQALTEVFMSIDRPVVSNRLQDGVAVQITINDIIILK